MRFEIICHLEYQRTYFALEIQLSTDCLLRIILFLLSGVNFINMSCEITLRRKWFVTGYTYIVCSFFSWGFLFLWFLWRIRSLISNFNSHLMILVWIRLLILRARIELLIVRFIRLIRDQFLFHRISNKIRSLILRLYSLLINQLLISTL